MSITATTTQPNVPSFKDLFGVKKSDTQRGGKRRQLYRQLQSGNLTLPPAGSIGASSVQDLTTSLAPFMNKQGKSIYNPMTGTFYAPGEAESVQNIFKKINATGGALEEGRNFNFDNVPTFGGEGSQMPQTQSMANQMLGIGAGNIGSGTGYIQSALEQFQGIAPQFEMSRQNALNELQSLQQQALSPQMSAEQRGFYQDLADRRRADIDTRFAEGGDIADMFQKQRQSDLAVLQNKGVLDSGTGANTLAARDLGLAGQYNLMRQQANEQNAQDLINERNAMRGAAGTFGGYQSQQAAQQGNSMLSALSGIAGGGQDIGQLGLGAGSLGVNLGSLANQQGLLDLERRKQAVDEAMGAYGIRAGSQQTQLGNLQSMTNDWRNWQAMLAQIGLINEQKQALENSNSFWGRLTSTFKDAAKAGAQYSGG